jgi:uncharacterized protein (TIGR02466 family)
MIERMDSKFNFTYTVGKAESPTASPAGVATAADIGAASSSTPAMLSGLRSFDLFPTRVWQAHVTHLMVHLSSWVEQVQAMRAASPTPAGRSNRQGWNSTDMTVLDRPEFTPLRDTIRAACKQALSEMGQGHREFELQSWINLHDRGGFNFLHMHEGSLISGSYYLQVPPGSGQFVFRDPRPGIIHGFSKGGMPNSHSDVHLTPKAGLLVLFPAWMEHYVEPHEADQPRITLAFNANPPARNA